jgi:ATP-dependent helicase HrpA
VPETLIRYDWKTVPSHLVVQVAVMTGGGKTVARGSDLAALRRECAAATAAELGELAGSGRAAQRYPGDWRRFELEVLPEADSFELPQGTLQLFPALARLEDRVGVSLYFSRAEASRSMSQGAVALARLMLAAQERDLRRRLAGETQLLLGAAPFMSGSALGECLLHLAFRQACFVDAEPPRRKAQFDTAVQRGAAAVHASLDDWIERVSAWFAEARALRQLLDDPRNRGTDAAGESRAHLDRLLDPTALEQAPPEWLRRLPLYLKAETRRWQRNSARGPQAPQMLRELIEWSARVTALHARVQVERRWLPELEALRWWVEEYRLSSYAQELKALGPVSPVRLAERAAEVEAWLER